MKIWYGINDAEDVVLLLIGIGSALVLLWQLYRAIKPVSRNPEPIPQGVYGVIRCNVDTPINKGDVITFNLAHQLEKNHEE